MEVTKEFLVEQIQVLKQKRDQALADSNAYSGAIQAYEILLNRLEQEPDAPEEE